MKYFFLLLCSLFLNAAEPVMDSLHPSANSCDFYQQLEQKRGCNDVGYNYATNYGGPYCERFLEKNITWLNPLREWVSNVTFCLQNSLFIFDAAYGINLSEEQIRLYCKNLEESAFESHHHCYEAHGFCQLSARNKFSVVREIMDINLFYQAKHTLKQALKTAYDCSKYYIPRCNLL